MKLIHGHTVLDIDIETFTPETAHAALAKTNGRQTTGRSGVVRYTEDMKNDRWLLSGEPIIFNDKGQLDNGYSRMESCITAKKPFTTLVVRGVPTRSFDVIDTGKTRSLADLLRFRGKDHVNTVGYIAKRLAARDKGLAVCSSAPVTRQEEMAAVRKYPEIEEYARKAQGLREAPHALLAFVWYIFGKGFPAKTAEFFRAYSPQEGDRTPSDRHPARRLRSKLSQEKLSKADRLRYAVLALNYFLDGKLSLAHPLKLDESVIANKLPIGDSGAFVVIG